jgi:hypothetical protein
MAPLVDDLLLLLLWHLLLLPLLLSHRLGQRMRQPHRQSMW